MNLTACLPLNGSDAVEAAQRLAKSLPSHQHRVIDDEPDQARTCGPRALVINGVTYPSLRVASRENRVSITAIYKWLDKGKARYV